MTSKGTRLVKPRLAHIAGVDHPAHQIEGFIVAKSLGSNDSSNLLEGLKMTFDVKEISKSLEAPLTKDNAADVIATMQKGLSFLISKAVEEEEVKKADGVKEATDTNEEHDATDVEKTKADGEDVMTMEAKAKAYDEMTAKKKTKAESKDDAEVEPDADDVPVSKSLSSSAYYVAMKKQLDGYKAKELHTSVETEVKKAAGSLQTNLDGFIKAIISAGGVDTDTGREVIKSLKATAEQLAVGGSFSKEIGANGAPISSDLKTANSQLKAIAKAISTEEGIPMTQAFVEAAKRNPELNNTLTGGAN